MDKNKNWSLKGTFYECCRVDDGHCALWFGRDLPRPCANMETLQITEGHIQNVDMKGVVIMLHQEGIGPKAADMANGAAEGAAYMSDNVTDEQRFARPDDAADKTLVADGNAEVHLLVEIEMVVGGHDQLFGVRVIQEDGAFIRRQEFGQL